MSEEIRYASPESQYEGTGPLPEDTEEMFWLKMEDDYASRLKYGNLLAGQYRYREAVGAYRKAERIRRDDPALYLRLGGALLTLFRFGESKDAYRRVSELGIPEAKTAFYSGAWHYLTGDYAEAASRFGKVLPADDENTVSAIYWHTLSALRAGEEPDLLPLLRPGMKTGHHAAYRRALAVFNGETDPDQLFREAREERSDLNAAILFYGLSGYYGREGEAEKARECVGLTLALRSVWPCVASLAARRDAAGNKAAPKKQG